MKEKVSKRKIKFKKNSLLSKIILVLICLFVVINILKYAAYFKIDNSAEMQVSIQNEVNVQLAHDIYIDENNVIYLSEEDIKKYLDEELYYEKNESNMRRYISISQNKVLEITENQNHMFVNGTREKIKGSVIDKDGVYYFPISELESIYNIELEYLKSENRLNIEKLSEEKKVGVVNKNIDLKYKMTNISKTIDELSQGDNVTIIEDMGNGWLKVKTSDYAVGYVKKSKIIDIENERYNLERADYTDFNMNEANIVEINDSTYENFNEKISNFDGREELVKNILDDVTKKITQVSTDIGVKVNITSVDNMENYYKFLRELKAHVNNIGVCVIAVDQPNMDDSKIKNIVDIVI